MPRDADTIHGRSLHSDAPNWQPLVDLVGSSLAEWFMWMFDIELADGEKVHAYKHIATRRYLHLAEDGRAFFYAGGERYCEALGHHAIREAFAGWESTSPEPDDTLAHVALLRHATERAVRRASLDEED